MLDDSGTPVLIEANRASHMLGEYIQFFGDERPFQLVAKVMNRAGGPPCLLWRRGDPFPAAEEDACFIGRHLAKYLRQAPVICNVEDNQDPRDELVSRDGRSIRPGSVFRWWYGLPWSYERSGVTVINPNCSWVAVRDKLLCGEKAAGAKEFRVPRSFPVESAADVSWLLAAHGDIFENGFVLKPRVGWGGYGVQVGDPGDQPREIGGNYLLSERIVPRRSDGRFWEARVFVMAGEYLGGLCHSSPTPMTNYWQGGTPGRLTDDVSARLKPAALEAVGMLDAAAAEIHALPEPPVSALTKVNYVGTGCTI